MAKKAAAEEAVVTQPFFEYLWAFYKKSRGQIRFFYKDLTKRLLDYNDPANGTAFLRAPQFEAFEMYVFLKEYLGNPQLADLLDAWRHNEGKFQLQNTPIAAQGDLFLDRAKDARAYDEAFRKLAAVRQDYANYIFALTMGVGKTILMATCIYYEFLLARKFPKDERFCHNAIVFAPDTTVLQSLREIQDFDMTKVVPPEYAKSIESEIKFHFLEESGVTLNTLDRSSFNVVISNTQKIIRKRQNKDKTATDQLFGPDAFKVAINGDPNEDLYEIESEDELSTNQRFQKLSRLHQLGIYVDEAHHAFGKSLKRDMADRESKTSLRLTIDSLAKELGRTKTRVVACYNFTGTPYVENELMPEVVYAFSLKDAIKDRYLKTAKVTQVKNAKSLAFIRNAIRTFVETHGKTRYEGMLPKMAIFASTIEELEKELKPQVEKVLLELDLPISKVLVNVGDEKLTTSDDIREFRKLDSRESKKQFILLVGKGKEGWNCRSLFSVALFREPKSKIFVLQATMRCLRSITDIQQEGHVFLSEENYTILKKELEANFRLSIDEFQDRPDDGKEDKIVKPRKPPVFVELIERKTLYNLVRKELKKGYSLDLDKLEASAYRLTAATIDLRTIQNDKGIEVDISALREDIEFTPIMLVAEVARYLNKGPLEVEELLESSSEGFDTLLAWVNRSNSILYEVIIPRLFKQLFSIEEHLGPEQKIQKLLVKDPPEGDKGYHIRVDPDRFVEEKSPRYSTHSDKSFHVSGYYFDSNPEFLFFGKNLPNANIKKLWFTGMLTAGQTEFHVHYIDPDSHALRTYYPDFLIEMMDGRFLIVEVKGENLLDDPVTLAKQSYAAKMADASRMEYVLIPSKKADGLLEDILLLSGHQDH
ncbi:MAG: DEAD/DEAH box helicase family protein [Spirochaetota bacterium]